MIKKYVILFLALLYLSLYPCFAASELYYLKNIKTDDVKQYVDNAISSQGYNVIKQNPYYAVSQDGKDAVIIILQQSGENMFYYFNSNQNSKINKNFLKDIKRQNIVCEQSFNSNIISIYDNLANDIAATSGAVKKYSFEEPEENVFTPPSSTNSQRQQKIGTLNGYVGQVAAGTTIPVYLQNAINTSTAAKGDRVVAVLTQDLIYNGVTIAPQGSIVNGILTTARNATYGSRNGRVVINFNQLITPENKVYDISAEEIDFTVSNEGKITESVKNAAARAAVGALVGVLFAVLSDNNIGRAAAIGAGVGAGASVIGSTVERGVDAEIPSFTELELTLTKPMNVSISY